MIINPKDEEALKRIINYPARGIGKSTMDKVILTANNNNVSIWEVITDLSTYETGLGNSPKKKLNDFATMLLSFGSELYKKNAYDLGYYIAQQAGLLKDLYADKTPEGVSRYENIQELLNGLKQFSALEEPSEHPNQTLDKFMEDVALLTDADNESEEDLDKVSLMTIHSAKGLEFPHIYIVGMEENLFPSQMSLTSRTELEEERRLFYVAITRGEKSVTLSYALTRFKFGQITYSEPSRFLNEIPENYLQWEGKAAPSNTFGRPVLRNNNEDAPKKINLGAAPTKMVSMKNVVSTPSTNTGSSDDIKPGITVEHLRFGKGKVLQVEGMGPSKKATIEFTKGGQKQILLKFAKLKIVG